jgi:predicted alpha-1,6-mannanase (GH76 family)
LCNNCRLYNLDETDIGSNYIHDLYGRIHDVCLRLAMDIFGRHARKLQSAKWKDVIVVDSILDNDSDLNLLIKYWSSAPLIQSLMKATTRSDEEQDRYKIKRKLVYSKPHATKLHMRYDFLWKRKS